MRWTIGRRLAAIGTLSTFVTVTVGMIGWTQALGTKARADEAFTPSRGRSPRPSTPSTPRPSCSPTPAC